MAAGQNKDILAMYGTDDIRPHDPSQFDGLIAPAAHDLGGASHNADTLADLNDKVNDGTLADKITMIDGPLSPQLLTNGVISAAIAPNVGKINISGTMTALVRTGTGATDPLEIISLAAQTNLELAAANTVYHVVFTRAGPAISIQVANANGTTEIGLGLCLKEADNTVHFTNAGARLQNGVFKLHQRCADLRDTELAHGCAISDLGGQTFGIAEGVMYHGINKLTPFSGGAFDSDVDKFTLFYGDGVNDWTYVADQQTIQVTDYYDGLGGLTAFTNNAYGCRWVYLHPDDEHMWVQIDETNDKLAAALLAQPPEAPALVTDFGALIGCIVVQEGEAVFVAIQMVTDLVFTGAEVADHGSLAGLPDDDHSQYHNDARGDARYPQLAHASRHENGGDDEVSVAGLSGLLADDQNPTAHATEHTDGTDDIQNATNAQKGLATAAQITALEAAGDVSAGANLTDNIIVRGDGGGKGVQSSGIAINDFGQLLLPDNQIIYLNTAKTVGIYSNLDHIYVTLPAASFLAFITPARITNLLDPTANQDAATKKYVDDNAGGMTEAFIDLYRTALFDMPASNTWYDFPWNIASDCKKNITHDAAGANPEQLILPAGTYKFAWDFSLYKAGVRDLSVCRILDDGVEIPGTYRNTDMPADYQTQLVGTKIAFVGANSVIEVQVGTHTAGFDINTRNWNEPDPTTRNLANFSILKLSDDTS